MLNLSAEDARNNLVKDKHKKKTSNSMVTLTGLQSFAELARTTLGGANGTIAVTGLPNKQFLMILCDLRMTGALVPWLRINAVSTGTPYAYRTSANGAADTATASANQIVLSSSSSTPQFIIIFIETLSTGEKLIQAWAIDQGTAGAGNLSNRMECVGKWANTANAITEIDLVSSTSTFAANSEVVVLGADPTDSKVTPFFQDLGRGEGANTANFSTPTITAKKYLMMVVSTDPTANDAQTINFNGDGGSNYSQRYQKNGTETTLVTQAKIFLNDTGADVGPMFAICFILNITANEKLMIGFVVMANTNGAANVPIRYEIAAKWANTANQITGIKITNVSGTPSNYAPFSQVIPYGSN